ncbi:MAG: AraC family transcriptional regulator, partial [Bacteroidota bacterium]
HTERDHIKGPFSLFYNLSGQSLIGLDKRWYPVSGDFYCLSNDGQHFNLHVPDRQVTQTFNIHFGESLFQDVLQLLMLKEDWSLDNFGNPNLPDFEVLPKTDRMTEVLKGRLQAMHRYQIEHRDTDYDADREYESLASILEAILLSSQSKVKKLQYLPASKVSTKKELMRRVGQALDLIHGNYLSTLELDDISRYCGLSKFHFIRTFKTLYGLTPVRYINHLKAVKARELITSSDKPFSQIALEVGFSELSSFTRFFKKTSGQSPSHLRQSH